MSQIIAMPAPEPEDEPSLHASTRWGLRIQQVWDASEALPPDQKAALRWLDAHARENNLSRKEVARLLLQDDGSPYSEASVYNNMTGRSLGKLDKFVRAIETFRKPLSQRSTKDFPFVKTALAASIFSYCDVVVRAGKLGFVIADNQVGKTTALEQYACEHEGTCTLIRIPPWGTYTDLITACCEAFGVSSKNRIAEAGLRMRGLIKPSMTLVFDELEQCFLGDNKPRLRSLEFMRYLHDTCGCPVIFSGDHEAHRALFIDKENERISKKLRRRSIPPYLLPNQGKPTAKDLNLFAAKLDLKAATGEALTLQTSIVGTEGLGAWLTHLLTGRTNAQNAGHPMTWDDVLAADATFQAMGGGKVSVPLYPALTAAEARAFMYTDMKESLFENMLIAAYHGIRSSSICGSQSICDDFASMDEDRAAVRKAVNRVAVHLRKFGYACTVQDTALDIEWGQ